MRNKEFLLLLKSSEAVHVRPFETLPGTSVRVGLELPLCMMTSQVQNLPPSLAFELQMSKFYHERIPKAPKMKTISA